ncbi:MAG: DUF4350 domain-containing protein [Nocardioides sp.]
MRTLSRHRSALLIGAGAVVAVLLTALLARDGPSRPAPLDPDNPGGDGAQAVARVLAREGVDVTVVRNAADLEREPADASTTIVVTSSDHLGRSTTGRLLRHQGAASLVVVAPGPGVVRQLGVGTFPSPTKPRGSVVGGCPAYDGLSLQVTTADAYDTAGCFRAEQGVLLSRPRPGLTLLGAPDALTNDQVLAGDNAAVALRLLGGRDRLVWYVPSLTDLRGGDGISLAGLLPDWLAPALWVLGAAGLGLVLWRARRLGPLAREPLPVEVKSVETTRNLGRLYRRSGDRSHAASTLRTATRASLAERLRLPRHADPEQVAAAVADHTGRPLVEVEALLRPDAPAPAHDRDLTDLALRLAELDREVSHR